MLTKLSLILASVLLSGCVTNTNKQSGYMSINSPATNINTDRIVNQIQGMTNPEIDKMIEGSLPAVRAQMYSALSNHKPLDLINVTYASGGKYRFYDIELQIDTHQAEKHYELIAGENVDQDFIRSDYMALFVLGTVQGICNSADRAFLDRGIGFMYSLTDQNNKTFGKFKIQKGDCEMLKNGKLSKSQPKKVSKIPPPKENPSGKCGIAWGRDPCNTKTTNIVENKNDTKKVVKPRKRYTFYPQIVGSGLYFFAKT